MPFDAIKVHHPIDDSCTSDGKAAANTPQAAQNEALALFLPISEIAHVSRQLADTIASTRRYYAVQREKPAVVDGTEILACHRRSYDQGAQIEDGTHVEALVADKRAARRHRGTNRLAKVAPSAFR